MRLDPHIHTEYSIDGIEKPARILEHIKLFSGLDAIAFTDHNRLFPRKEAEALTKKYGILVIPGVELGEIRSGKHIVALNLDHLDMRALLKKRDPCEIVEYISDQGGLSIAAHPVPRGYGNFSEMGFDAVELINGGCGRSNVRVRNPRNLPGIGCSDAHLRCHVGRAWTEVEDVCPETFDERTGAGEIRRFTEGVIEKVRQGLCHARGTPSSDALYLSYGLSVGKKYINKSFKALCSLVI
jgi:predicted metal-dependent phosphoesterase TrpH